MNLTDLTIYANEKFHIREKHPWADFPGFSVLNDPRTGKWLALLMRQWDAGTGEEIQRCDLKCGQQVLSEFHKDFLTQPFRMKGRNWVGVRMGKNTDKEIVFRLFNRAVYGIPEEKVSAVDRYVGADADTALRGIDRGGLSRGSGTSFEGSPETSRNREEILNSIPGVSKGFKVWNNEIVLEQFHDRPLGEIAGLYRNTVIPEVGKCAMKSPGTDENERRLPTRPLSEPEWNEDYKNNNQHPASGTLSQTAYAGGYGKTAYPYAMEIPEEIVKMRRLYEYGDDSYQQRCKNFYRQGKFMENYEDTMPWKGEYRHYFPTYHDLNIRMLRGYFTWRTRVRKGEYQPIAASLGYIYIYELLNEIGASSPLDALDKMAAFEKGFLDAGYGDTGMRRNLHRWELEFAVLHDLPRETAQKYADPEVIEKDHALAVLKDPGIFSDEEVFDAICLMGDSKLQDSPIIPIESSIVMGSASKGAGKKAVKDANNDDDNDADKDGKFSQKRGIHLFASTWRKASEQYQTTDGKDLFTALFGEPRSFSWYPLSNAVYWSEEPPADRDYELDECRRYQCRNAAWSEIRYVELYFDRAKFRGMFHEADGLFRRYLHTGRYLREKPEEVWVKPYAQAVIEEDKRAEEEARRPVIRIDLTDLDKIRADADVTRDSLLTEEELDEPEKILSSSVSGLRDENVSTTQSEIKAERELKCQAEETETGRTDENDTGENNKCDEKAKNTNDDSETAIAGLDTVHTQILRKAVYGEPVGEDLRQHHLMPSVVTDTINEALFDEIGDNVLECDGETISVVEDYREDLEKMLNGKVF